jgi:hypothetical protein
MRRRTPLFSILFMAGILVHLNVFHSVHTVVDEPKVSWCLGEECGTLDAPAIPHDATKNINIHGAATREIKAVTHGDISQYTSDNHQDQEPVHLVYAADDDDDSMRGVEQSISPSSILHRNQSSFITLATSPFLLSKKKYTFIICIISLNNIISKILSIRKRDLERNERHSMVVLRIMYGSS